MAYQKRTWVDDETYMNATNFNHMEDGIEDAGRALNIQDITVDAGVVAGDFIFEDAGTWKLASIPNQDLGTHIYDGTDAVAIGLVNITSNADDVGYSLYVQTTGKLAVGTTAIHAAYILSTSQVFVNFAPINERPKAYTANMVKFYAMIAPSGKTRLKIEGPTDATGVMIRRKSSAWTTGDTNATGTLVASITDWSSYKDENEWYEQTGLNDSDVWYYKAFPYKGGIYNETIGVNEDAAVVGGLVAEYFEVSGNVLLDHIGTNDISLTNAMSVDGVVGDAVSFSGNGYGNFTTPIPASWYFAFWAYSASGHKSGLIGNVDLTTNTGIYTDASGKMYNGRYNGGHKRAEKGFVVDTWEFVSAFYNATNFSLNIDNGSPDIYAYASGGIALKTIGRHAVYNEGTLYLDGKMCQIRLANRQFTSNELANMKDKEAA